jgi:hypothetical protein
MKKILSNPYGRDFIRVGLFFILMISVKYLYKPLDNGFVNGCIQGSIVGFIVLLIRFYIKKSKTEI